jgi:hypothetical protein
MQSDREGIENLLMNMVLNENKLKKHISKESPVHAFVLRNALNGFETRILYKKMLWDSIVALPKSTPMNHSSLKLILKILC